MTNDHLTARASIRRRIARLPVNAANRHLAREDFAAGEQGARRIVNAMAAMSRLLVNVRHLFRMPHSA
jgi:hypothetical protein